MSTWISKCVYGHANRWSAVTRPKEDDMAWCPRCNTHRRVFSVEKEPRQ